MVAIVTGPGTGANGAGITNSSAFVLGSRGQLGSAAFGQDGSDVYVNAANGNLAINRTDEILIGQGPDSDFGINIDSLGSINYSPVSVVSGLTGTVNTAGSTVKRTDWDQTITTYTWDASRSAYVSTAGGGAYNTLTYSTSTSTWTWKDGSTQTTITYGSNSRPAQETDANGNSLTFSYNGNLLSRITTSDGEHTDFTYSGTQVTKVTTTLTGGAALTRVYYAYDGSGRLSTVTTDLSPSDNSITDGKKIVTTYTYDGTSNRVASIAQTGGALLQITYDTSSRVKTLTQTLANGDTTGATFVYNSGYTSITDQDGQTTTVHFDSNGQLTKLDLPLGESTSYTYDSKGNVLTATDGNGNTTTYTYDTNGNLTQSEDALGNIVDYSYDSKNNLLTTTQYTVPSGSNQPPVALNESLLVTGIGDSITFDPRLGASDPDNDPLTITAVSTPSHGTAVIHSGSSITYTRTSAGSDSFTYTISDGNGHTVTATITIADSAGSTNHAPTAGNVTATVAGAGSSLTFDPRGSDSDADGDALTITSVSTPSLGTATIVNGGTAIKYTRSGSGSDSFTYTISDGHGHTASGYLTVDDSGGGTNSAPITSADHVYGTAGQIIYFDPRANDYDPDGDPLTITAVTAPSGAIALVGTGGTFIRFYDNSAKYADLTYTVSDGQGHTSTNSVHVDLSGPKNSAPVAHDDGITVSGNGTALTFNPLANDGDIDRDTLTITAVTTASHGTAVIVGGTQIKYTRSSSGTDSFTYTISDGNGHTATATVTVSDPVPANQAPVAKGDTIYVNGIGDSQTFNPRLNDSDFDTDSLTITAVSTPSHGTVTINSAASITYTRTSAGSDSFTYTISDGHGHTSNATVTVVDMAPVTVQTTNQAPTANAVTVDVPGTGTSLIFDPRASDSDPEGDALTIISISAPLLGTAEIINNGTAIRYTRAAGGSDSLTYTVSDGHGHTATGYITIDEEAGSGTNSAPVTAADHAYGSAGQIMYFDPRANDYDPDGDPLTITSVTAPSGGIALVGGSGTYIMFYDNSAKYANLNYTISDGQGHTSTNSIHVDLTGPKNSAPIAHNDGIVVSGTGASLTFDPLANDGDIDRDALTITAVTSASHGTAAIVSGGSEIKYTRSSAGTDSFTYTISDGNGHTATATVTVSDPIPTNQAPVAVGDNIVVDAIGDFLTYDPRVNDADLDADTLTITSVSTPSHGTVSIVDSGSRIKYTRTGAGDDSFTYTISDGHGHTKTATVKVTNAKGAPTPSAVLTTRYAYDTNGNLRFVVSAEGEVTEYKYNSAGEQTSSIIYRDSIYNLSGLGASNSISESSLETWASGITDKSTVERIDTTYDFRGNISTVTTYSAVDSSGNGLTSKPYTTVTYIYDQYGNLLHRQTSGIANSEVYVYDGLGRIVSSTDLNNATTTIGYVTNDTNRTTTTTVTLANGLVKTSIYNAAGLLVSYQESGSGITTATTTYKYDDLGR
jgi:YD repeat-containing protein